MLARTTAFRINAAQRGDALELLRSLPTGCARAVFFDPQYRGAVNNLEYCSLRPLLQQPLFITPHHGDTDAAAP